MTENNIKKATQPPVVHSVAFGYMGVDEWQHLICPALSRGQGGFRKGHLGGTNKMFQEFLPRFNIEETLCDTTK